METSRYGTALREGAKFFYSVRRFVGARSFGILHGMAEIKSALERALERTKDIKGDPESLRRHEAQNDGKRLFARILEDNAFNVKGALKEVPKEKRRWVREGLFNVARSNLTLPQAESDLQKLDAVEVALSELVGDRGMLTELLKQVRQFFNQYLDDRNRLVENLRKQYEPRIRQKEQQLSQQYGRNVKLDPANDPEFSRVLQDNLEPIQYQDRYALAQVDEPVKKMFQDQ